MANGMPERPLTAFTFFVKDYNQKHKGESNLFKEAATAWAHLEQKKKDKFIEMSNKVTWIFLYITSLYRWLFLFGRF
jgi:hypothetical protein